MLRSLCLLTLVLIVTGCGQKGPLYRPGEKTVSTTANSVAYAPCRIQV
ncbi:MAG: lipoprotein [Pseudomonadota bacterium]